VLETLVYVGHDWMMNGEGIGFGFVI
jgi:hypothetical protein